MFESKLSCSVIISVLLRIFLTEPVIYSRHYAGQSHKANQYSCILETVLGLFIFALFCQFDIIHMFMMV